jgi:hypothetical protein
MHELGVRVALGARGKDIVGLVVGRTMRLVVAGIVIGGCAALFASRVAGRPEPVLEGRLIGGAERINHDGGTEAVSGQPQAVSRKR